MVNPVHVSVSNTQRDSMDEQISFKDLLGTGAHFGHVTRKWHPNYEPFILMERNGVHIINLEETVKHLAKATDFIKKIVEKNGEILFVGTKKQAKDIVQQEADRCGMYYVVERWLGGTLTNFSTIKKSIKRLKILEKEGSSIYENLTKKEIQMLNRERLKLSDQHRGIKDMRRLPDAIVIVDVDREFTALEEAKRLEIPVVAIVDTNCDPRTVDYPIPANDDSIRTIQIIASALVDAILEVKDDNADSDESVANTNQADTPKEKIEVKSELKVEKDTAAKELKEVPKKVKKSVSDEKVETKKVENKPVASTIAKKAPVKKTVAKASVKKTTESKPVKKTPTKKVVKESKQK